jgi:uncharacterized paraquat-inducible protein A
MKKLIFVFAMIFAVGLFFTGCKENKKTEEKVESHEGNDHDKTDAYASDQAFHCTTGCEEGKTYDKEGNCPVCKSKLVVKTADADSALTASCSCKSGGDCACEGGCKCTA